MLLSKKHSIMTTEEENNLCCFLYKPLLSKYFVLLIFQKSSETDI